MSATVEIYGLYCPDTDELRYVGKANNAGKRLKTHLLERGLHRPVNRWVRSLVDQGKAPVLRVLETVPAAEWEGAERRLIAEHRKTANLLNLAEGGAMPSQTKDQRKRAAKASNAAQGKQHPAIRAVHKANFELSRLHGKFMRERSYIHAYMLKFRMRCYAADPNSISPPSWLAL